VCFITNERILISEADSVLVSSPQQMRWPENVSYGRRSQKSVNERQQTNGQAGRGESPGACTSGLTAIATAATHTCYSVIGSEEGRVRSTATL
jgi:hypothetical protein